MPFSKRILVFVKYATKGGEVLTVIDIFGIDNVPKSDHPRIAQMLASAPPHFTLTVPEGSARYKLNLPPDAATYSTEEGAKRKFFYDLVP
ncbi:MAG: hypothetical protein ABIG30_01895 [Candidatus Aenigmatarchaeota archaeon]